MPLKKKIFFNRGVCVCVCVGGGGGDIDYSISYSSSQKNHTTTTKLVYIASLRQAWGFRGLLRRNCQDGGGGGGGGGGLRGTHSMGLLR